MPRCRKLAIKLPANFQKGILSWTWLVQSPGVQSPRPLTNKNSTEICRATERKSYILYQFKPLLIYNETTLPICVESCCSGLGMWLNGRVLAQQARGLGFYPRHCKEKAAKPSNQKALTAECGSAYLQSQNSKGRDRKLTETSSAAWSI